LGKNVIFLAVLAALTVSVTVSCGGPQLKIYNWTYYTPETVIEKFEKENNVRVIYDQFASNEELFAKIKAGGKGFDIIFPSGDFVPIMIQEDMLERIDKSKMINLGNIDPEVLKKASYDRNMEYSVPYYYGAAGIIVNTAKVPDFERSWSIFSRQDLRNRMTMLDDMREVMGGALSFLGYSVNSRNPAEITEATNLINNTWKPNLIKFDSESFGKGYANGDFWVVHGFAENVFEEIAGNPQLMKNTIFFIPNEGGPAYIDNMCILKESKNIDLAHKFIDFIHRPDIYAEFVNTFNFPATVNIPARQYINGGSMYTEEDLACTELPTDLGLALNYFTEAWFNSIIIGGK
jgi:spermidine/putrescine transport system substrate-binding protein